jgi:hypothetical protein
MVSFTPGHFTPKKKPLVPFRWKAEWAPQLVWMLGEEQNLFLVLAIEL